jgi:hypothetical protein
MKLIMSENNCSNCLPNAPCGNYHVYVIELDDSQRYDFYVGSTGKTVTQRLEDNWPPGKYATQGGAPKLIRNHYQCMRMELVPNNMKKHCDRNIAELMEAMLADKLRSEGYVVRGPSLLA